MALVSVRGRQRLQCANPTSLAEIKSPFPLGTLDCLVTYMVPIAVVFVYEASAPDAIAYPRLQQALARLLDFYPHLTGRLLLDKNTGSRYITRLGEGAELLMAESHATLEDFRSVTSSNGRVLLERLPAEGNDVLPPFDTDEQAVCNNPLFTLQHTRFADGSVALGVRVLHTVCDASGFFQLMQDLAEIYRGLSSGDGSPVTLKNAPHIMGHTQPAPSTSASRSAPICDSAQFYLSSENGENDSAPVEPASISGGTSNQSPREAHVLKSDIDVTSPTTESSVEQIQEETASTPTMTVTGRTLRFTSAEIQAIKAEATDSSISAWVSTFEALFAHVWQSVYRARVKHCVLSGLSPSSISASDFLTPVDWRAPNRLNFSPRYFPNALLCAVKTLPPELLIDGSLADVANVIHDTIRDFKPDQASQIIDWMSSQPQKQHIEQRFNGKEGSCMISAWNKIDMYDSLTFDVDAEGKGVKPVLVAPPFTPISLIDGLGYILPAPKQDEQFEEAAALDVYLALQDQLWDVLENEVESRRFRTPI
jgi:hypothetical protein